VTVILESMPFGTPRRQRKHGIQTIQSLNGALLVHTEHRCVLGWFHVQRDNIRRLLLEMRIVAGHVAIQTVWLEPCPPPDSLYGRLAQSEY
jgi:hypothetical protein